MLWDATTGERLRTLAWHQDTVYMALFSADGRLLVTASEDASAVVWDVATGESRAILAGHEETVSWAAFSPDGLLVVTAGWDGNVRLWSASGAAVCLEQLEGHAGPVVYAEFAA